MDGFVIFSGNYSLNQFMGWDNLWKAKVWTKEEVLEIIKASAFWDERPTHIQRGRGSGSEIELFGEIREI